MLRFLFLLFGLIGLQTDSSDSELLLPVQIIIPEKKRSTSRDGVETNVSYNIVIDGKTYTVNLMQKAFLPPSFRVYGYNGTGYMKPFEQQIQNFCYYQGYIEGYPNSMVILSTCTGLRGLLQFENVSYGIEPLEPSVGFEHVIYQVNNKNTGASLYTEEDIDPRDLPFKIQSVQSPTDFSSYIEMHVVVEKNLYTHMGSDTAIVTQKIFQLIGLTNAIFTSFNITIILSSLELWIDENKMPVTGDVNELLHKFLKWKRSYLVLRPHDMAFLLVYREKSDYVGATFQGKMCDRQYGGGIAVHPKTLSLESLAVIIAQLLSLSMGIAYDDIDKCQCSGAVCIMNPEAIIIISSGHINLPDDQKSLFWNKLKKIQIVQVNNTNRDSSHSSGVKIFSNCSMEDFAHFISKPKSQCLRNHPRLDPSYKAGVCGNKKVEDGETCDCGTADECNQIQDNCCDSTTCALKAGSACLMGPCCTKCQFSPKGTPCRSSTHECDLPEYCNGSSGECQEDFYVQDGHPCEQNKWLCVQGHCKSMESQCAEAFGEALGAAPPECFKYLNSMADRSGSCGADASGYKKCDPDDVMCGKLICKHEGENILESNSAIIIYTNVNGNICVALEYKYDHAESYKMWVKDGTVCGTNKLCRKQKCIDNDLGYDCTPQKCHNQGVCNNKKNCHCNPKYLPPDCQSEKDSFPGGSVDSGNFLAVATTPAQARNLERFYVENVYPSKPTRWPFFLLIPFCVILSIMIITLVKVYLQRKKWKTEDYTSDEELESESEPQSSLENRDSIIS